MYTELHFCIHLDHECKRNYCLYTFIKKIGIQNNIHFATAFRLFCRKSCHKNVVKIYKIKATEAWSKRGHLSPKF